jgi:hypothetical protein
MNHIATIANYINVYKGIKGPGVTEKHEKQRAFTTCAQYLVACCWKKMYRRINHWSSQGFIHSLSIDLDSVERAFTDFTTGKHGKPIMFSKKKDLSLCEFFAHLKDDSMQQFMESVNAMTHSPPRLRYLQQKSEELVNLVLAAEQEEEIPCSKEAFGEFHEFVGNTLICYHHALSTFSERTSTNFYDRVENGHHMKKADATDIYNFARLLWRIAYSRIIRLYMDVLQLVAPFELPKAYHAPRYKNFILGAVKGAKRSGDKVEGVERSGNSEDEHKDLEPREGEEAEGGEKVEREEEEEHEEAEEILCLIGTAQAVCDTRVGNKSETGNSMVTVYLRWMRLQVSHFEALNILSKASHQAGEQDIKISVIGLNYSRPMWHQVEKKPWKDTILQLASRLSSTATVQSPSSHSNDLDAAYAIEVLQDKINGADTKPFVLKTFRNWDSTLSGKRKRLFHGNMYCEAALASLVAFPDLALKLQCKGSKNLAELIKVRSHLR